MLLGWLNVVLNCFSACFKWFGDLISKTENGGAVFISLFLGVFVSYTFVRLFLVNFIGSVSGDVTSGVKESFYHDAGKAVNVARGKGK